MDTSSRASTTAPESESASADPRAGQLIAGRYRLSGRIGRGGMGAIYEATHAVTGRRFAVKMLLPGLGNIQEVARRFEREARAASSLAHPNIVSVVDFGALDDGTLFLAMELVAGRALSDVLGDLPLPPARAFAITRQILEALAHAHRHGVVHRDLKPDNIMLVDAGASEEERDIVKIVDFGIAKWAGEVSTSDDRITQAGVAFGTPAYMAPEQALGEETDARADLYAVGVILYEMLAGHPPFESPDKVAILRMQVAVSAPPLPAPHPPEVGALLCRALAKRREARFEGAHEMLAAVEQAAAAQAAREARAAAAPSAGVATSPVSHLDDTVPGRRLWRDALVGLAAAAVILAGIIVATSGGGARPQPRSSPGPGPGPGRSAPTLADAALADAATLRAAGTALFAAGREVEAVRLWDRAFARAPGVIDEASGAALAAAASRGRARELRAHARELAAAAGLQGAVDLVGSYGLDLAQAPTCRERREAVPRLRALGDRRAIPALKKARGRRGGFLGLGQVNACLDRDAAEAIEFLQALP